MASQRKNYIDYLRVFACFSVILIHIFTTARTDFPNHTINEEIISKIIINVLHFAVPIFFMITGYLFLSKDKTYNLKDFFKKYTLKYIIAILTFGYGFAIIEEIFNKNFSATMPFVALANTIQGKTWAHMWYLYSLIGVMLLLPLLKTLLDSNKKYLKYILYILLISSVLLPLTNNLFNFKIGIDFIMISPYLAYAIIGYYLGNSEKNDYLFIYLFIAFICVLVISFSQVVPLVSENNNLGRIIVFGNYDSPFIMLLAICIFKVFMYFKTSNKFVMLISNYSYGIYLIHMFWINLMYKFINFNIYGEWLILKVLCCFIVISILSFITSYIMKRIPLLNKIV